MVAADLLRPSIPRLRWLSRTISTSYGGRRERLFANDAMPQKELSSAFPAIYNSGEVEQGWPEFWERVLSRHKEQGLTASQKEAREHFSLLLPPPNMTGTLHLGHALGVTIQDALVKWYRMKGFKTRWVPGWDHAGIATQSVVQRRLDARSSGREGPSKADMLEWAESKRREMRAQLKRMGVTIDWEHEFFTLDERCTEAVQESFIQLFRQGLIYRMEAPVNFCPMLQTVISDLEVQRKTVEEAMELRVPGRTEPFSTGILVHFEYPSLNGDFAIPVATTRPETLFGDVAVAVNPEDPRYSKFLNGPLLLNPFTGRQMPIVPDKRVDMDFGTGAVKVTPAHSFVDWEIGRDHGLSPVTVIDQQGNLNSNCGPEFEGMDRFSARRAVLRALQDRGFLLKVISMPTTVPTCSRSGDVIETLLREQWFFRTTALKESVIALVESPEFVIRPPGARNTLLSWLRNLKDWCISRQIQWGHRIPAYRRKDRPSSSGWVAAKSEEEARELLQSQGPDSSSSNLASETTFDVIRDPDVLDTWFSSALLPLTVNDWPSMSRESAWYPLSLMETGEDILFFWVARMMLMCTALPPHQIPFREVFLHGIVCDTQGRKMSKSLGNVVDPIRIVEGASKETMERDVRDLHEAGMFTDDELEASLKGQAALFPKGIPAIGADAMRFTFCVPDVTGQQMNLDMDRMQKSRTFGNKVWQACRFLVNGVQDVARRQDGSWAPKSLSEIRLSVHVLDKWILSRLSDTVSVSNQAFLHREFHLVTEAAYSFFYDCVCDVYLESIKPRLKGNTEDAELAASILFHCCETWLRLVFPIMPHLCDELWHRIHCALGLQTDHDSLLVASYPSETDWHPLRDEAIETNTLFALDVVGKIRSTKQSYGLKREHKVKASVLNSPIGTNWAEFSDSISTLGACEFLAANNKQHEEELVRKFSEVNAVRIPLDLRSDSQASGELIIDVWSVLRPQEINKRLDFIKLDLERVEGKIKSRKFETVSSQRREKTLFKYQSLSKELEQLELLLQRANLKAR